MTTSAFPSLLLDSPLKETENASREQEISSDEEERAAEKELHGEEIHRELLRQISYSGLGEFRSCERRFYLDKLTTSSRDSTVDTAFGRAVGSGVQTLWRTGNLQAAKATTFFQWDTEFSATKDSAKKSIGFALKAVEAFVPLWQILSLEWTLAEIDGVPAVEYSLLIEFPNGFRYRSYVDLILRHKETGEFCIIELKTNGSTWSHEATYRNSDQGISYSLVLDHIAVGHSNYWVKYFVFMSKLQEWVPYDFPKSLLDKVRWMKTTLGDIHAIEKCEKENYWPMRGAHCMDYGKPCRYFEICQLQDKALLSSSAVLKEKLQTELDRKYSFVIPLKQIVDNYLSEGETK